MALAPPEPARRFPRLAAVQPTSQQPSYSTAGRGRWSAPPSRAELRRQIRNQANWAAELRDLTRRIPAAGFAANITADTVGRVRPVVEIRTDSADGEWQPAPGKWNEALEDYRNDLMSPAELVNAHAFHYSVSGEGYQVMTPGRGRREGRVDWWIYSVEAVEFIRNTDTVIIRDLPNATPGTPNAREVSRDDVWHFWIPDRDWLGWATSGMRSSLEALRRLDKLARYIRGTLESRYFAGAFWTPQEAHLLDEIDDDEDGEPSPAGGGMSQLDSEFLAASRAAISDEDEAYSVVPWPLHTPGDKNVPRWIGIGRDLDSQTIAHIKDGLEDFARGTQLPSALITGGGVAEVQHWGMWLVDEKFFTNAIAPTCDRVFHGDLTATLLPPHLRMRGLPEDGTYRIGYDATEVIVHPDQSQQALAAWLAGLIGSERARGEAGWGDEDKPTPEDLQLLRWVLLKGQDGAVPGAPTDGTTTQPGPPAGGPTPPATPPAPNSNGRQPAVARVAATPDRAALRARLAQVRRDVGRELLTLAEATMKKALEDAGVRVRTRAHRREVSAEVRKAALAAIDSREPLAPFMAAVGLTEANALDRAFTVFQSEAERKMRAAQRKERGILRDAGVDPEDVLTVAAPAAAAGWLVHALTSVARDRLRGVPTDSLGEQTGLVPFRVVRDAMRVAEGRAVPTPGASRDDVPELAPAAVPSLDELVAPVGEGAQVRYRWIHGFYGEPDRPFEPHEALDGYETEDREGDAQLAEDAVFGDLNQPDDHPGCTCAWETVDAESGALVEAIAAAVRPAE